MEMTQEQKIEILIEAVLRLYGKLSVLPSRDVGIKEMLNKIVGGGGNHRRTTMKLATFLLENKNEYNGHKQTELGEVTFGEIRKIMEALEEENPSHLFYMKMFVDGSGRVEQAFYWREGEHPLGHVDRIIFGFQLKGGGGC